MRRARPAPGFDPDSSANPPTRLGRPDARMRTSCSNAAECVSAVATPARSPRDLPHPDRTLWRQNPGNWACRTDALDGRCPCLSRVLLQLLLVRDLLAEFVPRPLFGRKERTNQPEDR